MGIPGLITAQKESVFFSSSHALTDCFIVKQILVLEDLDCQTGSVHLDVGSEVYNLGSKGGTAFLAINPDISIKFREYFGKKKLICLMIYLRIAVYWLWTMMEARVKNNKREKYQDKYFFITDISQWLQK